MEDYKTVTIKVEECSTTIAVKAEDYLTTIILLEILLTNNQQILAKQT